MKLDDVVFYFGGLLGGALGIFSGLLMLLSPPKLVRFAFLVGRIFFGFKPREVEWRPGVHLEWRLVGLTVAGFSAFVFSQILRLLLHESFVRTATTTPTSMAGGSGGWNSLLGGLVFFLIGVYTLVRADKLVLWMNQKASFRVARDTSPLKQALFFRLVGLVWIVGAVFTLHTWFKSLR